VSVRLGVVAGTENSRRWMIRVASSVIGLGVVWLTVVAFTRANPVDLTVALLVVLAEVLAVAVLSGPMLAVIVALAAVVLVNWYLVPPYGTFTIASAENVVALVVFVFVAAVAAALVEIGARARARAQLSTRQAELLGEVVVISEGDDTATALERIRSGLHLDRVDLIGPGSSAPLATAGSIDVRGDRSLDVPLSDGYRLVGYGPEVFAPDRDFLTSLGSAAVLAFENERLQDERRRGQELAAIDRARTALLASVGHDLRTPLAGLRVCVDTLRSTDADLSDQDRQELLATIADASDRLDVLITNLLDMSRLQAGVVLTHLRATDLAEVVDEVLMASPDSRIDVDVPESLPLVRADPALLERVVANLISNALRYSPPRTRVRIVGSTASSDAAEVLLDVSDDGPGIPEGQRDEAFEPFHRIGAQPDGGSGLGLAIVRGFSDAMGIEVEVLSGDRQGLTVRLRVPAWQETGAAS
jgi:K+-sensing histidine kinase KdpD